MKTKYVLARAKPTGHHMLARRSARGLEATAYAVSEFSGARVEYSITGNIAAAPLTSKPTSRQFDPTKARVSRRVDRPDISVIVAPTTATSPSHQKGLKIARPGKSGRTTRDSTNIAIRRGAAATHKRLAHLSLRSCTGPSVFNMR